MDDTQPVTFTEDRIPAEGIETAIEELVDLYGGEISATRERERQFTLPLRRGVQTGGGVECTLSWTEPEAEAAADFRSTPAQPSVATSGESALLPRGQTDPEMNALPATLKQTTVTLRCDRDVDAPKLQRVLMLVAGVIGGLLFTIWPFFPQRREFGALAWIGGAIAIAVYFLTLRKTSGGIAFDFLQRLARRQRALAQED